MGNSWGTSSITGTMLRWLPWSSDKARWYAVCAKTLQGKRGRNGGGVIPYLLGTNPGFGIATGFPALLAAMAITPITTAAQITMLKIVPGGAFCFSIFHPVCLLEVYPAKA